MIGPSLIFDKSTIQSLNLDESVWLDNFYIVNITPLFFVETLADLEKEVKAGRSPEQVVGNLAYKTPDTASVNTHHRNLLAGELMGEGIVKMDGRPCASGGKYLKLGNETGLLFQEPPEKEAFNRWQKHEFLEIERNIARKWRNNLNNKITDDNLKVLKGFFKIKNPQSLDELKDLVNILIDNVSEEGFIFYLFLSGVPQRHHEQIINRWEVQGRKNLKEFVPYFAHVLSIDLFYYLGLAANLFDNFPHSQTHKIDLAYLYYLPFCSIFTSNDKFHKGVAKLFMRENQTFINGEDLKKDMAMLNSYYLKLPEEIKNRGVVTFAFAPPVNDEFLTTQMWNKYMSPQWKEMHDKVKKFDGTDVVDSKKEKELLDKIQRFTKNAKPVEDNVKMDSDEAGNMIMSHMVHARKGSWRMFPPEVENSKKRVLN